MSSAIDDENMRKSLPPGFATQADLRPALNQSMREKLSDLNRNADTSGLVKAFTQRVRSMRTPTLSTFRADVTVLDQTSHLRAPSPDAYRITQDGDRTMLEFEDVRYYMPAPVAAAMQVIRNRQSFRPTDLPGPLDTAGRLGLCRHLNDMGFLTIVAPD